MPGEGTESASSQWPISGLPVLEINLNERVFLNLIKFELHVSAPDFQKWVQRLATLPTPSKESPSSTSRKNGLARSASEYPPAEPMHDLTLPVRPASTNQLGRARSHPQLVTGRRHSSLPRAPRLPVVVDVAADPAAELDRVDAPIPPTPEESSCSASNASLSEDEEEEEESRSPRQYRQLPRERSASNYGKISRARAYAQAMDVDPLPSSNCRQASSSFSGVPAWANSHNVVA